MSVFDMFRRRPAPPPPAPAAPSLSLSLRAAPAFTPLPVQPNNRIDAAISRQWLAFQQKQPQATWDAFLAHLKAENARIAKELDDVKADIRNYS